MPWQYCQRNTDSDSKIESYAHPVALVYSLKMDDAGTADTNSLIRVADEWIYLSNSGKLRPMVTDDLGDSCHAGVKDEICTMKLRLAFGLNNAARRHANKHEFDLAAGLWLRALKVANIMKYSDFPSLTSAHSAEKSALNGIASIAPRVSDPVRKQLLAELLCWIDLDRPLDRMLMRQKKALAKFCNINGVSYPAGTGLGSFSSLASLVAHEPVTPENMRKVRAAVAKSTGEVVSALSHVKIAWLHESDVRELGNRAIQKLSVREEMKYSSNSAYVWLR